MSGSSRSARAASARVAAAASSGSTSVDQRHDDVQALRPAGLDRARQPGVGQRPPHEVGDPDDVPERIALRWVEVEHQVRGEVGAVTHERRVVLDGPLVGEPQQRAPVVAERVVHLALGRLRPDGGRPHPVRGVLRHVLLHERGLAGAHADHRERPVPQPGQDPVPHRVEVVDQVALGRLGAVEQRLVEVGQRDTGPGAVLPALAHRSPSLRSVGASRLRCDTGSLASSLTAAP